MVGSRSQKEVLDGEVGYLPRTGEEFQVQHRPVKS